MSWIKNGLVVVCSVIVFLAICEAGLRLTGVAGTENSVMPVDLTSPIIHRTPNHSFIHTRGWNGEINVRHKTNEYGFNTHIKFSDAPEENRIALIGDSFVEAKQVPSGKSVGGLLYEAGFNMLPIGISGMPLSQYLAFAKFAQREFAVEKYIFIIISNDFDESLSLYKPRRGSHYFDYNDGMKLKLRPFKGRSLSSRIFYKTALKTYLYRNLKIKKVIGSVFGGNIEESEADVARRIELSKLAVKQFFKLLDELGIKSSDALFVLDADRDVIQKTGRRSFGWDEFRKTMMGFFKNETLGNGFALIDTHDAFVSDFLEHGKRFDFKIDGHWNERGHRVVTKGIMKTGFMSGGN